MFSRFSGALIVVGGSGVTFGTSVVQEMVRNAMNSEGHIKVIDLVWVVQDVSKSFLISLDKIL